MGIVYTGEKGIPLKDIIKKLGNKNYDFIEFRCKMSFASGFVRIAEAPFIPKSW